MRRLAFRCGYWDSDRRAGEDSQLRAKQNELADINRKQQALAYLQTDFANLKPDISLICERLLLFAEIWSSVRSQSVQFQEHLKGGLGAATNLRFRREVQLAKDTCDPLQVGLQRYAVELGGRLATKGYKIEDGVQAALRQVDEEVAARRKKRLKASSSVAPTALGEDEEGLTGLKRE